jgi:flavodoxin
MPEIVHGQCLKVLVVYYSFTGNTRILAQALREKTCGVMHGVDTYTPYLERTVEKETRRELESGDLPFMKYPVSFLLAYDFILVGGPVWHYTVSTPLMSFLSAADFGGNRVAAFCTHERGVGRYFHDFACRARNARLVANFELNICRHDRCSDMEKLLVEWLDSLGILCPLTLAM